MKLARPAQTGGSGRQWSMITDWQKLWNWKKWQFWQYWQQWQIARPAKTGGMQLRQRSSATWTWSMGKEGASSHIYISAISHIIISYPLSFTSSSVTQNPCGPIHHQEDQLLWTSLGDPPLKVQMMIQRYLQVGWFQKELCDTSCQLLVVPWTTSTGSGGSTATPSKLTGKPGQASIDDQLGYNLSKLKIFLDWFKTVA